jgi:2-polyprenyl-3-methyl-5-hydroxy-6-metoxy-1,4-benzoquinol methylase
MPLDVVSHRELFASVRSLARSVPFIWSLYGFYWRVRRRFESNKKYPDGVNLVDFGEFPKPTLEFPTSQLCTAEQMLSPTYDDWCRKMHSPARFSRKQWEFVYILQVLEQNGVLQSGKTGLGFGCGREPLVGLFASHGCQVVATDLEPDAAREQGWAKTMQHSASLEALYECAKEFVGRDQFYATVEFKHADMNQIPESFFGQFDFVWSACALEHLGSLQHGLQFIKNSLKCLKAGGVAVHTTEFNLSSDEVTFESPACSLYRARDIRELIRDLEHEGYEVAPLNLNRGHLAVDRHIDIPPYGFSPHIKLLLEGYVVTSIGLKIQKPVSISTS